MTAIKRILVFGTNGAGKTGVIRLLDDNKLYQFTEVRALEPPRSMETIMLFNLLGKAPEPEVKVESQLKSIDCKFDLVIYVRSSSNPRFRYGDEVAYKELLQYVNPAIPRIIVNVGGETSRNPVYRLTKELDNIRQQYAMSFVYGVNICAFTPEEIDNIIAVFRPHLTQIRIESKDLLQQVVAASIH